MELSQVSSHDYIVEFWSYDATWLYIGGVDVQALSQVKS